MSDSYEETVRIVRALDLENQIDEMRAVRTEDGRNTVHVIEIRGEFGQWGPLAVGLARRRKGDRRDPNLGGALSLYRAIEHLLERHREAFAKRWPEYFPKGTVSAEHHEMAVKRMLQAGGEQAERASRLEQRIERALELLEASPEAWLGSSNDLAAAAHVLRGGDAKEKNPSNERGAKALKILEDGPREVMLGVVEAWSSVAGRALAVLRGEVDGEESRRLPRSLGAGEGPEDLSEREGFDAEA